MIDRSLTQSVALESMIRLGRAGDGGYSVPATIVASCDSVIGLGVRDDWSFEADAAGRMPQCRGVHLYDPTTTLRWLWWRALGAIPKYVVHAASWDSQRLAEDHQRVFAPIRYLNFHRSGFRHFSEWAGGASGTDLETIVARMVAQGSRGILLKCDIEGCEYDVLRNPGAWSRSINLIVAEFHDLEPSPDRFHACLIGLAPYFTPVHIHGNTLAGQLPCGFPRVPEITFVRNDLIAAGSLRSARIFPVKNLDQGNHRSHQPMSFEA
jgi:hypothetical protein